MFVPKVAHAVLAIKAIAHLFQYQSEPYRASAHALGWAELDGTPWWDEVMEAIG